MSRYIDADELKKQLMIESSLGHIMTLEDVEKIVDFIKTASVREVKRGKWIERNVFGENPLECPFCGNSVNVYGYSYCPNCGEDMRGEEE